MKTALALASCSATLALNFQLDTSGTLPDWLPLIPAGRFQGRDGRWWINDRPDEVIAALNSDGREIPWDVEHATELKAPKGDPAPACAFTGKLENRNGVIWGEVAWNSEGEKLVGGKQYKYYSPAFRFDRDSHRVLALSSIGLTNKHNLPELPALNNQTTTEESVMKLSLAIAMALALNSEATEEDAVNAINKLKAERDTALNREATPSLDKYVPRAEYDAKVELATNAEQKLAAYEEAEQEKTITALVDDAVKSGKVTPASREFYLATCRHEGGIESFKTFISSAPVIVKDTDLNGKNPDKGNAGTALNAEEKQVATLLGLSEEAFSQSKTA